MRSFADSDKAQFWSDKNIIRPEEVTIRSGKKFWFEYSNCNHDFESSLVIGVPTVKTETKLLENLRTVFPKVIHQAKFNWCKHTTFLPFDFYIPSKKLIIELDGPQHFIQISNWDNPFKTQIKDAYKDRLARQNGYTIIRLLQEDVLYDKANWNSIISS
jgi:very-short-patch-repair endonuclease